MRFAQTLREALHAQAPPARCGSRQDIARSNPSARRDGAAGRAYAKANF
jgi:hypothetical protein